MSAAQKLTIPLFSQVIIISDFKLEETDIVASIAASLHASLHFLTRFA
jgi:hypothetical protein